MFKGNVESLSCWCILFVEKVQFVNKIPYPIFLRISRVKHYGPIEKKTKNFESDYSITDANHTAQFDCEFPVPVTLFQRPDGSLVPKILDVEIVSNSGKENVISRVRMDVANLKDPRSKDRQISKFDTKFGAAELTFRLVVIPVSEMPEKPFCYFGFISLRSVQPVVEDVGLTVSEFSEVEDLQPPNENGVASGDGGLIVFDNSFLQKKDEVDAPEKPKESPNLAMFMRNKKQEEKLKRKQEERQRKKLEKEQAKQNAQNDQDQEDENKEKEPVTFEEKPKSNEHKKKTTSSRLKLLLQRTKPGAYTEDQPKAEEEKQNDDTKKEKETEKENDEQAPSKKDKSLKYLFRTYTNQVLDTTEKQLTILSTINMQQCKVAFTQVVFDVITVPDNREVDQSAKLIAVLQEYYLNKNPELTPEKLNDVISPLYAAAKDALDLSLDIAPRFGVFATILNFGILFSSEFCECTSATNLVLSNLESILNDTITYFYNHLMSLIVSSIMGDGFEALDKEQLTLLTQSIRAFTQLGKRFHIPEVLIQAIVVECCTQFDTLMYNVIIDTAEQYTAENISLLTDHIREIQKSFECFSSNFQIAFPHLLEFIKTSNQLLGSIDPKRIKPSPTLRSIFDRCSPSPSIPEGLDKNSFGPETEISLRSSLKVPKPKNTYNFTFEKLFIDSATGAFD